MAARTINIDTILNQVRQLDYIDRINLLERVISLIKKENVVKEQVKLASISGLGSEVWRDVDIDKYVENERQWD
ncbi:hypothetical protein I2I11_13500 [Pontibacter sp. 172403-2]|uniref:hypothetical protein n=1 Tax=Pontibacter rufus TaxID=2791028 RepID=UPI0018AFFFA7|nr:hypothetical protein [Pontibacter sp. 172403-2]MBF9254315.1 hypothetical protein [Pontibacter sp. 172403-2]